MQRALGGLAHEDRPLQIMCVSLVAGEVVRVGGEWIGGKRGVLPGEAGPTAEAEDVSPRTVNPSLPSQAVRNVYLSRWEDRTSFIYQFVSLIDNSGVRRHMLCAADAPPTVPRLHQPDFQLPKSAPPSLWASAYCGSQLCCQNSRQKMQTNGAPGSHPKERLMGLDWNTLSPGGTALSGSPWGYAAGAHGGDTGGPRG